MKNNRKKIDFQKLLSNKSVVIPLSVICAFVIWIIIAIRQNPTREHVFTDLSANISIENTATSEMGLGIVSDISSYKFSVTVKGPNYIVSSLKPEDFTITADLSSINAAGTYNLNVKAVSNSQKTGYSIVSVSPSSINVAFDYFDTKEYNIVPSLIGVSAAEGLVAESPIPSNSEQNTITVKGPRNIMKNIESAGSVAEVNKTLSSSESFESDVVLYDKDGEMLYRFDSNGKVYNGKNEEISDRRLTLSFTSLMVTQPISRKKSLSVTPTFSNIPKGIDANSISASVNVSDASVIGTPDIVDKMATISLSPIDFKDISPSNTSFEITASLPDGVKLVDSQEKFIVTLDMSNYIEKTVTVSNVKFTNLVQGLTATKNASVKKVKICGPIDVISSLNERDLYASVDLSGKNAGNYTIDAVIGSDKYNNIWAFGTYTVSVAIK